MNKTDLYISLGQRIRKFRREMNMTQGELADRLGVTQATLSRYEFGVKRMHIETLQKIGYILDKTIVEMLGMTYSIYQDNETDYAMELSRYAGSVEISEKEFQKIIEYIDFLTYRRG